MDSVRFQLGAQVGGPKGGGGGVCGTGGGAGTAGLHGFHAGSGKPQSVAPDQHSLKESARAEGATKSDAALAATSDAALAQRRATHRETCTSQRRAQCRAVRWARATTR
eukprot:COSAG06_NODE_338_length_17232_cov_73.406584_7_plen_109_part_00